MQPTLRQVPPWRGALLHHGDLHPELRRADGADIAAGPGADDDRSKCSFAMTSSRLLQERRHPEEASGRITGSQNASGNTYQ